MSVITYKGFYHKLWQKSKPRVTQPMLLLDWKLRTSKVKTQSRNFTAQIALIPMCRLRFNFLLPTSKNFRGSVPTKIVSMCCALQAMTAVEVVLIVIDKMVLLV